MEQFTQEKSAFAFQQPFTSTAPAGNGGAPQGGALKPFTAVDIAPPARPGTPAPLGSLSPAVSPFLENFASPFEGGEARASKPAAPKPAPAEPRPRPGFHGAEPMQADDFMPVLPPAPKPAAGPVLSPAPLTPMEPLAPAQPVPAPASVAAPAAPPAPAHPVMAPAPLPPMPAAARQSQILAAADLMSATGSGARPRFFITTTAVLDGFPIQAYLDVVSAEIVLPKDLLFRNPAPYGDLHRLKAAEEQLQRIKAKAIEEMTDKAKGLHADGVVGVSVTFTNLDTVCCLCTAVGTAVRIA